jgi:hypothetical protein
LQPLRSLANRVDTVESTRTLCKTIETLRLYPLGCGNDYDDWLPNGFGMPEKQSSSECGFARAEDGTPICGFHKKPLQKQQLLPTNPSGPQPPSMWVCPVSRRLLIGS